MKTLAVALALVLASYGVCQAEETVDCSSTCPEGQVVVSYTDGNSTTCVCQPAAEMDATVADPAAGSEGTAEPAQNEGPAEAAPEGTDQ